jgi:hypothetical protein
MRAVPSFWTVQTSAVRPQGPDRRHLGRHCTIGALDRDLDGELWALPGVEFRGRLGGGPVKDRRGGDVPASQSEIGDVSPESDSQALRRSESGPNPVTLSR